MARTVAAAKDVVFVAECALVVVEELQSVGVVHDSVDRLFGERVVDAVERRSGGDGIGNVDEFFKVLADRAAVSLHVQPCGDDAVGTGFAVPYP